MSTQGTTQGTTSETALRFARHIVNGEFDRAREMLVPSMSSDEKSLQTEYHAMLELYDEAPESVAVVNVLDDWPGKQKDDIGWAYVSISGSDWSEGVAVVVSVQDSAPQISEVVWGRP